MIKDIFYEFYRPLGWRKQGQNFRYFQEDGLGRIINFQKSKWNTRDDLTFYINYGLYIEAGDTIENKTFPEYICQILNRTDGVKGEYRILSEKDIPYIKRKVVEDLREVTGFFNAIPTKKELVRVLLNGEIADFAKVKFLMSYPICKLLSDMGYHKEIYDIIKDRDGRFFESLKEENRLWIEKNMQ